MTTGASGYGDSPAPTSPQPASPPQWAGPDLILGAALVVLLISLFLPWFSAKVISFSPAVSGTADGTRAHGYLWVVFALVIVALAVLIGRDAMGRLPGNLPSAEQMLVGATGLALLLSILGVLSKPPGYTSGSNIALLPDGHLTVAVSWSYGGFVAILAAAAALVAAFGTSGPLNVAARAARRATPASPSA